MFFRIAASSEVVQEEPCQAEIRAFRPASVPDPKSSRRAFIRTFIDDRHGLTVHRASGLVAAEEILDKIAVYYLTEAPSWLELWDFTGADVKGISRDELRRIARLGKEYAVRRKGGKTALVFSTQVEYGLGRMFEAFAVIEAYPFEVRSFRSVESARQWLGIDGVLTVCYYRSNESLYNDFSPRRRKAV